MKNFFCLRNNIKKLFFLLFAIHKESVIMSLWWETIILRYQSEHKDTGLWMCIYCSLVAVSFVILFDFVLNLSHCMNKPRDADV